MLKKLMVMLFIGKNNVKYINKYLLYIILVDILGALAADHFKGQTITASHIADTLLIKVSVVFLGFRLWVGIFKGSFKVTSKVWDKLYPEN